MPEGDTLHRLAARLREQLPGERVTYAWNRHLGAIDRLVGECVESSEARGKNLLIGLSGGWTFRVHLSIGGRCGCRLKPDEPPPIRWATLVLDTEKYRTLVWKTSRVELMRSAHLRAAAGIRSLGPDLLEEGCDLDEVMRRARAAGNRSRPVGELLMDQRVAAGPGNVIRCEALFLARADPWARTDTVDDDKLRACFVHAQRILHQGARIGRRDTTREQGEHFFVYGRARRPCLVCGAAIACKRQGDLARVTYHCPRCQRGTG